MFVNIYDTVITVFVLLNSLHAYTKLSVISLDNSVNTTKNFSNSSIVNNISDTAMYLRPYAKFMVDANLPGENNTINKAYTRGHARYMADTTNHLGPYNRFVYTTEKILSSAENNNYHNIQITTSKDTLISTYPFITTLRPFRQNFKPVKPQMAKYFVKQLRTIPNELSEEEYNSDVLSDFIPVTPLLSNGIHRSTIPYQYNSHLSYPPKISTIFATSSSALGGYGTSSGTGIATGIATGMGTGTGASTHPSFGYTKAEFSELPTYNDRKTFHLSHEDTFDESYGHLFGHGHGQGHGFGHGHGHGQGHEHGHNHGHGHGHKHGHGDHKKSSLDLKKIGIIALVKIGLAKLKAFGILKLIFLMLFKFKLFLALIFVKWLLILKTIKLLKSLLIPLFLLSLLFLLPLLLLPLLLLLPTLLPLALLIPIPTPGRDQYSRVPALFHQKPQRTDLAMSILSKFLDSQECIEKIACQLATKKESKLFYPIINWYWKRISNSTKNQKVGSYIKAYTETVKEYQGNYTNSHSEKWCQEKYPCDNFEITLSSAEIQDRKVDNKIYSNTSNSTGKP
ncbi:hypothetical protein PGB90_010393 [Kerria lacca]